MYLNRGVFLLCVGFFLKGIQFVEGSSSMEVNTERIRIQKFEDYWQIRFLCISHAGSCYFQFTLLPEGWSIIGQKVRVPLSDMLKIKSYLIEATIRQPAGDSVQKEIVLHADHGEVFLEARDKPFYYSLVSADPKPQSQVIQTTFQPKNESELSWLELNGIVPYVPTLSRLDSIIKSGNILQIVRTIQNIVSDNSNCDQKAEYLQKVAKRLDKHKTQNQQKLVIQEQTLKNVRASLERLNERKNSLIEQIQSNQELNSSQEELKQKEKELAKQLRENLSKHHTYTIVSNRYLNMFKSHINSSAVDPKELQKIEDQIVEDEQQIENVDRQIEELVEKKKLLEARVKDNQKKIRDTKTVGDVSPQKLNSLENNYKKFSQMAFQFKRSADELEKELEMVKKGLMESEEHAELIKQQLKQTERQIKEVMQVDEGDIADLQLLVGTLERNTPFIHNEIEECQKKKQEEEKPPTIIYPTRDIQQPNDLLQVEIPPISQFSLYFPILEEFSLFTSDYIVNYGPPKLENFACGNSNFTGYGILTDIEGEMFRVRTADKRIFGLVLGSCTDLKSRRSSYIPSIGDIISWEGEQISPIIINVHVARMFKY